MRWVSWLLGILGVAQYGLIAYLQPTDYVSVDMAYLVMWLAIIGALLLCSMSWCGGCYGDDGCDCCGPGCECGDGECCMPQGEHGHEHGHEGHGHDGGHKH